MRFTFRARLRRRAFSAQHALLHQLAFAHVQAGRTNEQQLLSTLVFLHEGLGSAELWRDVPVRLQQLTGCAVLAYSRSGNGFTPAPSAPRAVSYMHDEADVLETMLRERSIEEAILVGHSDGASIAVIHAARYAQRIKALVLLAPHVFVEDHSIEGIRKARELYETTDLRARLAKHHTDVDATFYGWNDIWLDPAFRVWNIREYSRNVRAPVLAIQGAQDEYGTFAHVLALCEDVPAPFDALHVARCGHNPLRDRPETLRAIADYVTVAASK